MKTNGTKIAKFVLLSCCVSPPESRASNSEIEALSEELYIMDVNKTTDTDLVLDLQVQILNNETSGKNDFSPLP